MTAPFQTLLLDIDTWDLTVDSLGNIAVASAPYALAQDVASAARTFLGEVFYDKTVGVDYFGKILGKNPPPAVIQQQMVKAALTVPGVVRAQCILNSFINAPVVGMGANYLTDSSGNPITDSSGGTVTTLPAPTAVNASQGRQVNGQILFVDVNNQSQSVQL